MADTTEPQAKPGSAFVKAALKPVREHLWAAVGVAAALVPLLIDLFKEELTTTGVFGAFLGSIFFLIDVTMSASASEAKVSEKIDRVISEKLNHVETAVENNTFALRAHEQLLSTRTTDSLTLIAFKNLLAYLPFYLAKDLGYLQDEHISITTEITSLDDENTARLLQENPKNSIAICDPYMCISYPRLSMVYPICSGIAAWPMTLNWIGSTAAANDKVQVAAYKAPSTTHVLAQLVKKRVIIPRLSNTSNIVPDVVELKDEEAKFGEREIYDDVAEGLRNLLMKYDVLMLWEPHCEIALRLGARYLFRSDYEKILSEFGKPLMYSGLVISKDLVQSNPTLPIRLRRALDRAVARLQDPDRLPYCEQTLNQRRMLSGLSDPVCESVLSRQVKNVPPPTGPPTGSTEVGMPGWSAATGVWADGIFAADNLRRSLVNNDPLLGQKLQYREHQLTNSGEFRQLIYMPGGQREA